MNVDCLARGTHLDLLGVDHPHRAPLHCNPWLTSTSLECSRERNFRLSVITVDKIIPLIGLEVGTSKWYHPTPTSLGLLLEPSRLGEQHRKSFGW